MKNLSINEHLKNLENSENEKIYKSLSHIKHKFLNIENAEKKKLSKILPKLLKKKNSQILEKTLKIFQKFFLEENSKIFKSKKIIKKILKNIYIRKKKYLKNLSESVILIFLENLEKSDFLEILENSFNSENEIIILNSFDFFILALQEFGIFSDFENFKKIFFLIEKKMFLKNFKILEKGIIFYIEIYRYVGKKIFFFLERLGKYEKKQIYDFLENSDILVLKGKREKFGNEVEFLKFGKFFDFSKFGENWKNEILGKKRYKDILSDLKNLEKNLKNSKFEKISKNGKNEYFEILEVLKFFLDDGNIKVQILSIKNLGLLSKNLKFDFLENFEIFEFLIFRFFLSSKPILVDCVLNAFENFYDFLDFKKFCEIFKNSILKKNKFFKKNLLILAEKILEKKKEEIFFFWENCEEVLKELKFDNDLVVRDLTKNLFFFFQEKKKLKNKKNFENLENKKNFENLEKNEKFENLENSREMSFCENLKKREISEKMKNLSHKRNNSFLKNTSFYGLSKNPKFGFSISHREIPILKKRKNSKNEISIFSKNLNFSEKKKIKIEINFKNSSEKIFEEILIFFSTKISKFEKTNKILKKFSKKTKNFENIENSKIFEIFLKITNSSNIEISEKTFEILKNQIFKFSQNFENFHKIEKFFEKILLQIGSIKFFKLIFFSIFKKKNSENFPFFGISNLFGNILYNLFKKISNEFFLDSDLIFFFRFIFFYFEDFVIKN